MGVIKRVGPPPKRMTHGCATFACYAVAAMPRKGAAR
jgi:hypothetical protein